YDALARELGAEWHARQIARSGTVMRPVGYGSKCRPISVRSNASAPRHALGLLELALDDDAPPVPARAADFVFVTHVSDWLRYRGPVSPESWRA
ncbi:MAG: hypothetical protein QOG65_3324, partial [Actinomycetota bacterium]|nr:hypothetical protein [Actinomycetota bacterium]